MRVPSGMSVAFGAGLVLVACAHDPAPVDTKIDDTSEEFGPVDRAGQRIARGEYDEALVILDEALRSKPDDVELHYTRGVVLRELARVPEAKAAWERAVAVQDDYYPALNGLGALALEREDFAAAIDAFTKVLRVRADFADAHYNLGLALLGQGRKDEALKALDNAVRLKPRDADVLTTYARSLADAGRTQAAVDAAKRAISAAPADPFVLTQAGHVLIECHEPGAAVTPLRKALEIEADDDTRFVLATALSRAGEPKEAVALLEALAAAHPKHAGVWAEWGTALAKQGQLGAAVTKFDTAIELRPQHVGTRVHRIGALVGLGRCKLARTQASALAQLGASEVQMAQANKLVAACRGD